MVIAEVAVAMAVLTVASRWWNPILGSFDVLFRTIGRILLGTVVSCHEMGDQEARGHLVAYLRERWRGFGLGADTYTSDWTKVRSVGQRRLVYFKSDIYSFRLSFYRCAPILFVTMYNHQSAPTAMFLFFKWTIDWHRLLREAGAHADIKVDAITRGNYEFFRYSGAGRRQRERDNSPTNVSKAPQEIGHNYRYPINWPAEDLGEPIPEHPMDRLALSPSMSRFLRDVRFWNSHRSWYEERAIAWRRGYLLYGPPGTGKTSMARAIAQELGLPVHSFDIASMDADEFLVAWAKVNSTDSPRIVLFEDIDTVFHGRDNVVEGSSLSFTTLLNTVDGIDSTNGLMLIVTANHPEHIDPALGAPTNEVGGSTRPGRIDMTVHVDGVGHEGLVHIARRAKLSEEESEALAHQHAGSSPAQFQEACQQHALAQLWGDGI